jgi:HAD superfamily hydrolase (TIGR01484 family)
VSGAIKLLVSDVDGTLVDKEKKVTPATVDAVERLKAAGLGFTIISARPRSGMMPIAELLGIDEPMGAFNGGIVFKRDGTVIEHHMIDVDVVRGARWRSSETRRSTRGSSQTTSGMPAPTRAAMSAASAKRRHRIR